LHGRTRRSPPPQIPTVRPDIADGGRRHRTQHRVSRATAPLPAQGGRGRCAKRGASLGAVLLTGLPVGGAELVNRPAPRQRATAPKGHRRMPDVAELPQRTRRCGRRRSRSAKGGGGGGGGARFCRGSTPVQRPRNFTRRSSCARQERQPACQCAPRGAQTSLRVRSTSIWRRGLRDRSRETGQTARTSEGTATGRYPTTKSAVSRSAGGEQGQIRCRCKTSRTRPLQPSRAERVPYRPTAPLAN